jgi:hypothetical protein
MPSIAKAGKPELVQTFVPESAVEALDVGVLDRPDRANEVQAHAILMSPKIKGLACELRPVIDHYDLGHASLAYETVKNSDHPKARKRAVYLEREALPTVLIHDVEAALDCLLGTAGAEQDQAVIRFWLSRSRGARGRHPRPPLPCGDARHGAARPGSRRYRRVASS